MVVAANKVDDPAAIPDAADFYRLGLGDPMPVSAAQGLGTGDLLDRVVALLLGAAGRGRRARTDLRPVDLAVIGRPNVGKSSLVNAFLGEERVIVSELAGTTRDAIDTRIEVEGREVVLVDTAGLRRRAKVAGTVDYYAQLRSERAAARADVAIVVADASAGLTSEDLRVGEVAMRSGCATVVALNKWDIGQTDLDDAGARARAEAAPAAARADGLGAHRPRRPDGSWREAIRLADRAAERIPTADLNRFLADLQRVREPPSVRGRRLRLYYMTQYESAPPRFAVQVSDRGRLTRDYAFFLENRLRDRYGLQGVPLVIDYRGREEGRRGRSSSTGRD